MSEIVKDEPVKPMDRAVWNVEHVIKFSKSKHLRYHGHDVSFIDYYGTIAILTAPLVLLAWCCYLVIDKFKGRVHDCFVDKFISPMKSKFEWLSNFCDDNVYSMYNSFIWYSNCSMQLIILKCERCIRERTIETFL